MKAAVIIISVAVLILLLCISRLHFSFESMDGTTLSLRFLFIKFRLYPKKQKKVRLSDYSLKKVKGRKKKADSKKFGAKRRLRMEIKAKIKAPRGMRRILSHL